MSKVAIFWDPNGIELDSLGSKQFLRATDGDTPYVAMSIRMLSIDTPELHYPANQKPSKMDDKLAELAEWLRQGKSQVDDHLAAYLYPKLATGRAGTLHEQQGQQAMQALQTLVDEKLKLSNGKYRSVFLRVADQPFDDYGRVLAYVAPNYSPEERATLSRMERATFNLLMVANGWAAPFPVYPSLPQHLDLTLLHDAAETAFNEGRGAWADANMLTGYEFRMCVKLYDVTKKLVASGGRFRESNPSWISRYCVDMTTREIYYPQEYIKVLPYNRIFVWPNDVSEAVSRLNLTPGG